LHRPTTYQREHDIRKRWKELEPAMIIYLRGQGVSDFVSRLLLLQATHRAAILLCLDHQIDMRLIRRYRLDNPVLSDAQRLECIQDVLAIRRRRPGRRLTPEFSTEAQI
jgi:hypothetical protein